MGFRGGGCWGFRMLLSALPAAERGFRVFGVSKPRLFIIYRIRCWQLKYKTEISTSKLEVWAIFLGVLVIRIGFGETLYDN